MRYHGEISISEQQKCISHDIDWSPWFHSTPAAAQQYLGTPLWELALVATFGGVGSVVDLVPRPPEAPKLDGSADFHGKKV